MIARRNIFSLLISAMSFTAQKARYVCILCTPLLPGREFNFPGNRYGSEYTNSPAIYIIYYSDDVFP